jgi:hypothetical protein
MSPFVCSNMWPRVKHYLKIYPIVEGVKKGSVLAAFEAVNKEGQQP